MKKRTDTSLPQEVTACESSRPAIKRGPPSFSGRREFTTKSTKDTKNGIRELSNRVEGVETGLLMNFNATKLKNGINRFVL